MFGSFSKIVSGWARVFDTHTQSMLQTVNASYKQNRAENRMRAAFRNVGHVCRVCFAILRKFVLPSLGQFNSTKKKYICDFSLVPFLFLLRQCPRVLYQLISCGSQHSIKESQNIGGKCHMKPALKE